MHEAIAGVVFLTAGILVMNAVLAGPIFGAEPFRESNPLPPGFRERFSLFDALLLCGGVGVFIAGAAMLLRYLHRPEMELF